MRSGEKRQKAGIVDASDKFLNHEKQARKVPHVHENSAGKQLVREER